ncbi:hypothetical protein ACSQ67_000864 [Phaseolus vulgaris]
MVARARGGLSWLTHGGSSGGGGSALNGCARQRRKHARLFVNGCAEEALATLDVVARRSRHSQLCGIGAQAEREACTTWRRGRLMLLGRDITPSEDTTEEGAAAKGSVSV